jgi:hypothetical protein
MSIPSWAVRGARVVCKVTNWFPVDDAPVDLTTVLILPMKGRVYTISDVIDGGDEWELTLEECGPNDFPGRAFGPVAGVDDDLKAHFVHLLDAPVRVPEEA